MGFVMAGKKITHYVGLMIMTCHLYEKREILGHTVTRPPFLLFRVVLHQGNAGK